jgi:hypothetical protein
MALFWVKNLLQSPAATYSGGILLIDGEQLVVN